MLPYDRSNKASSLQLWHSAAGYMWQALIEMFGSQAAQLASRLGSAMPRRPSHHPHTKYAAMRSMLSASMLCTALGFEGRHPKEKRHGRSCGREFCPRAGCQGKKPSKKAEGMTFRVLPEKFMSLCSCRKNGASLVFGPQSRDTLLS